MLSKLLIVFIPNSLKLLLFRTILIDLLLEFRLQFLDHALETLDLGLLEVQVLELILLRLQLDDLLLVHALHSLAELIESRLVERDLLATVPLLLFELDWCLAAASSPLPCRHIGDAAHGTLLHQGCPNGARH